MLTKLQSRPPQDKGRGWNLLLAVVAAACVLIVLVLQIVSTQNSPVSLALLTILISGFTGVWQFRKCGLDPVGLFCCGFVLYDGLLLLRLSLASASSVMLYPTSFGYETYAAAGSLCAIAAVAVLLTTGFGAVGAFLALVAGREVLTLVYRPEYAGHQELLVVMVVDAATMAVGSFLGFGMTAVRSFRPQVPIMTASLIVSVALTFALIPRFGLLGAGYALMIASLIRVVASQVVLGSALKRVA
jgi:hypothetical protein